ncbi:hypothetical protein [Nocardia sp. NPDC058497]|uniref:MmyB family transcriptional regulator n=1 Tax=Nocardia sp. NPDC058497 TaxID=3346529 RepID=UPI003648633E
MDWERMARLAVGALRTEAGKNPYDREPSNLIGELSTRSDAFRVIRGSQDVCVFSQSTKRLHRGSLSLLSRTPRAGWRRIGRASPHPLGVPPERAGDARGCRR